MTALSTLYSVIYQFGDNFAYLVLAALGLAVIFGMMGVINLAHGEFIMCGAYVTIICAKRGIPLPIAMLFDSVVATWAISLIVQQTMLLVAGPSMEGISTPFGSFMLGEYSFSTYRAVLPVIALGVLGALYWLFFKSNYGVCARATIQNANMAQCLGLRTDHLYTLTFALGAGLAGLTGALYAPTMTAVPTMGTNFIVQAFVSVVVGGANVIAGTTPAAAILAVIQTTLTALYGQLFGQIGLLLTVIVVIRLMPQGLGNLFNRTR
jgi:branched-chain amino acid transport system permease protein